MDTFGVRTELAVGDCRYRIWSLPALSAHGFDLSRLPYSLRILLENLLRQENGASVTAADITALAAWDPAQPPHRELAFSPARVLMQDFTGVPAIVDLAAMRDAMADLGADPRRINPLVPVELVIDHSMQVDVHASPLALEQNRRLDYERNSERYALLRWAQGAFANFRVVPPYTGICHQVNLEYLARVVFSTDEDPQWDATEIPAAFPDTLVGTDSHTPMINGLGVLGWGVGGIEAEAAILGQPIAMLLPQVVGFRLKGELRPEATATDLVLTVTEMLRQRGVVGKFVEFYGPGIAHVPVADRATIGNMSPEYGATCAIFPVDAETLRYLRLTGRSAARVALVEAYMKAQGLFYTPDAPSPAYSETLELDLATVEPSLAGPRRPQDRVPLSQAGAAFASALEKLLPIPFVSRTRKDAAAGVPADGDAVGVWGEGAPGASDLPPAGADLRADDLDHGAVVIASITSCTNTSNPSVMLAAGLLARKAVERGLRPQPWVKTSLAPGSKVVTEYLERAGLMPDLEALGFHVVGYGCATCIGNSGPLPEPVSRAIAARSLVACAVLSGNRNFEGRIHSEVRANYLMSPPLVVAYALAGRMTWNPLTDPLGTDPQGRPVFLRDLWPTRDEIQAAIRDHVDGEMFRRSYASVFRGDEVWRSLPVPAGERFTWDPASTYVKCPPYFAAFAPEPPRRAASIVSARVLAVLGDSTTTDHISPAGSIRVDSPAGRYLVEHGVPPADFNSYGARRGNHEAMVRGTFANVRIRNRLAPETEGGFTTYLPTGEVMPIADAASRYQQSGTPLLVLAGMEYGTGSSRDWAAKGPLLQGVRAVIAGSFERIHRSNLVGMGVLPLQFLPEHSVDALALTGRERFDVLSLAEFLHEDFVPGQTLSIRAVREDGTELRFPVLVRIDTPQELHYYLHGGILPYVLRQLCAGREVPVLGIAGTPEQLTSAERPALGVVEEGSIESFPASDPPAY